MDDFYRLQHEGISISGANPIDFGRSVDNSNVYRFQSLETDAGVLDLIKSQIVSHPHYPRLLSAYIECRKVASMLLFPVTFMTFFFLVVFLFISLAPSLLFDCFFFSCSSFCRWERRQKWRRCSKKSAEKVNR